MPVVFQNPLALFALPLVAGPLLIHLWSRRRFEDEPWGAIDFLLRAVAARARRMWLENLLLLAARTLALALLVLGFADPRWRTDESAREAASPRPRPTLHVIVLDGSYSMQATTDGVDSWTRARQLARALIESARAGDGFLVATMGQGTDWAVQEVSFSPADIAAALDDLRPLDTPARLDIAIESILDRLARPDDNVAFDQVLVHWFTDLENDTWREADTPRSRVLWKRLAKRATSLLHTVPFPSGDNHYCRSLIARPAVPVVNEPVILTAELENAGAEAVRIEASFYETGRLLDRKTVELAARQRTQVSVTTSWSRESEVPIEVRLSDDLLAVDNRRYLVVPVRRTVRVLCAEGAPGNAKWVELALTSEETRFAVTAVSQSSLARHLTGDFDVLLLINPRPVGPSVSRQIEEWLNRGKGVIVSWGDQMQPTSWKAATLPWLAAVPLEPAPLGNYRIDPLDYRHPMLAPFRGNERSGLRTVPIWKYVRLKPNAAATTVLALDDGAPLLIEQRRGAGRVLALAVPLESMSVDRTTTPPTPWSALPVWPTFVPLVQRLVREATRGAPESLSVQVGQPLRGTRAYDRPVANPVVLLPDGQRERLELEADPPWWRWRSTGTTRAGWARIEWNEGQPLEWRAVNLDPRESDLQQVSSDAIPEVLQDAETWHEPAAQPVSQRSSLFRVALLALLAILLLEGGAVRALAAREG